MGHVPQVGLWGGQNPWGAGRRAGSTEPIDAGGLFYLYFTEQPLVNSGLFRFDNHGTIGEHPPTFGECLPHWHPVLGRIGDIGEEHNSRWRLSFVCRRHE